jgi:hypothetical protein
MAFLPSVVRGGANSGAALTRTTMAVVRFVQEISAREAAS